MSLISDTVYKHIHEYDSKKTGKHVSLEAPKENIFTKGELYAIGRSIISELEGILSDKFLEKQNANNKV